MTLPWWKPIRRADIPATERELLERYGPDVIRLTLLAGWHPAWPELTPLYKDKDFKTRAATWLTEKRDEDARREDRLETVEWAILLLVLLEVLHDFSWLWHAIGRILTTHA
jgi:hypothetical protein